MQFFSYLINGISLRSVYALIALGYTMVYGIAKMLNFAHGDVIMIGSYVVFFAFGSAGMNPVLAIVLSMVVCTVLGVTIERVAYRPLREAPSLAVLITAIGVSYLLQQVAQLAWTSNPKSFTSVVSGLKPISLFGGQLTISAETVVTIIACIVIMVVLIWFVNNTPAGHAMLAVSEDRGAAQLMGVNVNATISLTFAIGSALAAVAGALLCSSYPTLQPTTGAMPGIKAFTAAVIGGIGSIPGAMLGGILLGTGGLVRAYTAAASGALQNAELVSMRLVVDCRLRVPYAQFEQAQRIIAAAETRLDEPIFDDAVTLCWRMPAGREETLRTALNELTRGGAEVEISAPQYAAF